MIRLEVLTSNEIRISEQTAKVATRRFNGMLGPQVAEELNYSTSAITMTMQRLRARFDVDTNEQLVAVLMGLGLVEVVKI